MPFNGFQQQPGQFIQQPFLGQQQPAFAPAQQQLMDPRLMGLPQPAAYSPSALPLGGLGGYGVPSAGLNIPLLARSDNGQQQQQQQSQSFQPQAQQQPMGMGGSQQFGDQPQQRSFAPSTFQQPQQQPAMTFNAMGQQQIPGSFNGPSTFANGQQGSNMMG